ncbi:phage tail protein [Streptomyces sp. P1-3]|uniref:phage tail protein n=1 Tax=Streptomyces sp. P1-3 TaxID=3421658 RepID=UPI003D36E589
MPLPDLDSSVANSFGLEFDSVLIRHITEVSGLKMEQDVIELKQNTVNGQYIVKKLPGKPKAGEVTVTRGLTEDNSFERWIKDSRFGRMSQVRRSGSIIVFDYEGMPIKRYKLIGAWPKSLEISTLKAGDTSVLTEKLVITYESVEVD